MMIAVRCLAGLHVLVLVATPLALELPGDVPLLFIPAVYGSLMGAWMLSTWGHVSRSVHAFAAAVLFLHSVFLAYKIEEVARGVMAASCLVEERPVDECQAEALNAKWLTLNGMLASITGAQTSATSAPMPQVEPDGGGRAGGRAADFELLTACVHGNLARVDAALANGADIDTDSSAAGTPMQIAARDGNAVLLRHLIAAGADLNFNPGMFVGRTPLIEATMMGHLDAVVVLVEAGADVNKPNTNGQTPLDMALVGLHGPDVAAYLVGEGARSSNPRINAVIRTPEDVIREMTTGPPGFRRY